VDVHQNKKYTLLHAYSKYFFVSNARKHHA